MNAVVKTHLAIVDALEGGDGRGNFLRLNTLVAGRNPAATDTVACQMAGFTASEHETFRLCAEYSLGPCTLDAIEVVGEALDDVAFDLTRLRDGVLEMPAAFCLDLLSTGELLQIQRALHMYELVAPASPELETRDELLVMLAEVISADGYHERALAKCTSSARALLEVIAEHGGTSSSMVAVEKAFSAQHKALYYYPSHRTLTRLGLAYAVDSATRDYYLLPEGIVNVL